MSRAARSLEEPQPVSRNPVRLAGAALALALAVAACGGSPSTAAPDHRLPRTGAPATTPLTVGLGYIPNVQFAQFYLADQAGYYADAGLDVTLQNKIDPDLITLLGQGAVDIGSGDGTSVIPAVSQGIPVVYTSTIYGTFPAVVIAKAGSGIATAADLRGKRIGVPGRYGTNWIMLQALLKEAGLTAGRRDDRGVPGLQPGRRAPAGPGGRRHRLRQQRADPAPERGHRARGPHRGRRRAAARAGPRDRHEDARDEGGRRSRPSPPPRCGR